MIATALVFLRLYVDDNPSRLTHTRFPRPEPHRQGHQDHRPGSSVRSPSSPHTNTSTHAQPLSSTPQTTACIEGTAQDGMHSACQQPGLLDSGRIITYRSHGAGRYSGACLPFYYCDAGRRPDPLACAAAERDPLAGPTAAPAQG